MDFDVQGIVAVLKWLEEAFLIQMIYDIGPWDSNRGQLYGSESFIGPGPCLNFPTVILGTAI